MAFYTKSVQVAEYGDWERVVKHCRANSLPYVYFDLGNGTPGTWTVVDASGGTTGLLFSGATDTDASRGAVKAARDALDVDGNIVV